VVEKPFRFSESERLETRSYGNANLARNDPLAN